MIIRHANYVRKQLDNYGLNKTESVFNEWNYSGNDMFTEMKRMPGAAFCAAVLCGLQSAAVDSAMHYAGDPIMLYNALYENLSVKTTKTYLVFETFGKLYSLGTQVSANCEKSGIYTCAAKNAGDDFGVMAANYEREKVEVTLKVTGAKNKNLKVYLLDDTHDMDEAQIINSGSENKFVLSKNSVAYISNPPQN